MKISVLIPAYNASATIKMTLDSVLSQTLRPEETLVFNDGSTDGTSAILEGYKSQITIFQDSNHGLSYVRNYMGHKARGDVLAFLDADDTWHPDYLKLQADMIEKYPDAVGYFTKRENNEGLGDFKWPKDVNFRRFQPEMIQPVDLLRRSNQTPLNFQMSGCCVPKHIFSKLGPEPFRVNGAEDTYFVALLVLLGPVAFTEARPVAYRIIDGSASVNRLKGSLDVLQVFDLLETIYREKAGPELFREFKVVRAARRRNCGKYLMGVGRIAEARKQFLMAVRESKDPVSALKSVGQYCLSCLPKRLQPRWPAWKRDLHIKSLAGDTQAL